MHATCKAHKNLALFDFDGTLYDKDSFTGFIFYVHSKRHIALQGLKVLPYIQSYYLGFYPYNMTINQDTGYLYVGGAANAFRVIDLSITLIYSSSE